MGGKKFEIIYCDSEMDRVQRPAGHPLAIVEAHNADEALRLYQERHKLTVAGYEKMAVLVRSTT